MASRGRPPARGSSRVFSQSRPFFDLHFRLPSADPAAPVLGLSRYAPALVGTTPPGPGPGSVDFSTASTTSSGVSTAPPTPPPSRRTPDRKGVPQNDEVIQISQDCEATARLRNHLFRDRMPEITGAAHRGLGGFADAGQLSMMAKVTAEVLVPKLVIRALCGEDGGLRSFMCLLLSA